MLDVFRLLPASLDTGSSWMSFHLRAAAFREAAVAPPEINGKWRREMGGNTRRTKRPVVGAGARTGHHPSSTSNVAPLQVKENLYPLQPNASDKGLAKTAVLQQFQFRVDGSTEMSENGLPVVWLVAATPLYREADIKLDGAECQADPL